MIVTRKSLPRRAFLRGLGTTLALPLLDSMVPAFAATGAAKSPTRLGFVYHPVGMIMDKWTPAAEGAAFEFTPIMRALEPFRQNLVVLSGLAQVNGRALGDGPGDHAREGATWLTGVHPKRSESNIGAGISVDQIAAKEFGKQTQLASLEIGLESPGLAGACDQNYSCAYTNTVSWRTPTIPLPMETNPRAVFERLFGDGESTNPDARREMLKQQRSILDYVAGSIDRLETKLGARDRGKLTEYLEAIRDIERRIQKAEMQSAELRLPAMERPAAAPEVFEEHARLMMDLQVIAYQTDMTRVITFMLGRAGSNRSYRAIGISDGHHTLSHHMNDPEKIEKVSKIDAHLVDTFAYYLNKLKSTPDGDGSLLDHTMIVYGSALGDANIHTHHDLPTAVIAGSSLIKGGRHLRYPKETPLNNLFLNLLDKAGAPSENFGDSTGKLPYLSGV
ncbi:MAG: DUF1552 domain-containing protein [Bryobacterales bacterium]|nr:DUF1552 domain-containing protein [Bryobacterales bacterium]